MKIYLHLKIMILLTQEIFDQIEIEVVLIEIAHSLVFHLDRSQVAQIQFLSKLKLL